MRTPLADQSLAAEAMATTPWHVLRAHTARLQTLDRAKSTCCVFRTRDYCTAGMPWAFRDNAYESGPFPQLLHFTRPLSMRTDRPLRPLLVRAPASLTLTASNSASVIRAGKDCPEATSVRRDLAASCFQASLPASKGEEGQRRTCLSETVWSRCLSRIRW